MTYQIYIPVNHSCPKYRGLTRLLSHVYNQVGREQFKNYSIHIKEILNLDFDENTHTFTFESEVDATLFTLRWLCE